MVRETQHPMANDESRPVFIENLKDIADAHVCKSSEILTELRIQSATTAEQMIHMSACFQELNASLDEHMKNVDEGMKDIKTIITRHETDIVDLKHNCRYPEYWEGVWKRIKILEEDYQRRQGATKWDDRIYEIVKYLVCAVLGAVLLFFMQGGKIS
jgi:hypothetical protein